MKKAIVIDSNDIKKILSERFNVPEGNVIKSQYSYTVIFNEKENPIDNPDSVPDSINTHFHQKSKDLR